MQYSGLPEASSDRRLCPQEYAAASIAGLEAVSRSYEQASPSELRWETVDAMSGAGCGVALLASRLVLFMALKSLAQKILRRVLALFSRRNASFRRLVGTELGHHPASMAHLERQSISPPCTTQRPALT